MGLFEALDGSSKNASSCFIEMCICGDVLQGMNKIFIQMLLCSKGSQGRAGSPAGSLAPEGPRDPWGSQNRRISSAGGTHKDH